MSLYLADIPEQIKIKLIYLLHGLSVDPIDYALFSIDDKIITIRHKKFNILSLFSIKHILEKEL